MNKENNTFELVLVSNNKVAIFCLNIDNNNYDLVGETKLINKNIILNCSYNNSNNILVTSFVSNKFDKKIKIHKFSKIINNNKTNYAIEELTINNKIYSNSKLFTKCKFINYNNSSNTSVYESFNAKNSFNYNDSIGNNNNININSKVFKSALEEEAIVLGKYKEYLIEYEFYSTVYSIFRIEKII